MDKVQDFLLQNGRYDAFVLIRTFKSILALNKKQGYLLETDVLSAVSNSSCTINFTSYHQTAYCTLIIKACMDLTYTSGGKVNFNLKKEIDNEIAFFEASLKVVSDKKHPNINSITRDMKNQFARAKIIYSLDSNHNDSDQSNQKEKNSLYGKSMQNIEHLEPIVNFLAKVRKLGMDILFPQIAHDQVNFN
jgi:hypothetical protein